MPKETDFKIVIKKPGESAKNSTATQTQQKPKQ